MQKESLEQNPLNCTSCKNKEPIPTPRWASETPLRLGERCKVTKQRCKKKFTSLVGCASHSSSQCRQFTEDELQSLFLIVDAYIERGNGRGSKKLLDKIEQLREHGDK